MSNVLYTVIDGSLINLANVNAIQDSKVQPGSVIVSFHNGEKVVLNGTVATVMLKLGGGPPMPEHGLGKAYAGR